MGLVINHNMPAIFTNYMLDKNQDRLAVNTARLSSGLRIIGPEDDPAGYGIRETMRSELMNMEQGIRNVADGISMIQTAEGAMSVIDEKLSRMRELAEQAANGTYTTLQREIINSEYQAMAAEIDRIANATNFNGVKLLDGSMTSQHDGQGLKIHFGAGNNSAEDYYFVKIDDMRATTSTGLRVGGDAKNDIWSTASLSGKAAADGCCGGGIPSLNQPVSAWNAGTIFSYGYNWDLQENDDTQLSRGRYVAGAYQVQEGMSLERLIDSVNRGSQSRVRADFKIGETALDLVGGASADISANVARICIGNEVYYFGSTSMCVDACSDSAELFVDMAPYYSSTLFAGSGGSYASAMSVASAFVMAVNSQSKSFWAKAEDFTYRSGYVSVYVFSREGGNNDYLKASDDQIGGKVAGSASLSKAIMWYNDETDVEGYEGAFFGNGGEYWGVLRAQPTGYGTWGVSLHGKDVGTERDLWVLNTGSDSSSVNNLDINFYGYSLYSASNADLRGFGLFGTTSGMNRESFFEVQNASDGDWNGASIRTQSTAQLALDAVTQAIVRKDTIRAKLGAIINRLENTLTNLETMHGTLQEAESRISDVDIATEMTDFVRNQVLSQAAVSILSQANALPEMALSLLNG
jgi:flagellin